MVFLAYYSSQMAVYGIFHREPVQELWLEGGVLISSLFVPEGIWFAGFLVFFWLAIKEQFEQRADSAGTWECALFGIAGLYVIISGYKPGDFHVAPFIRYGALLGGIVGLLK
jgi:hypothetical protein